MSEKTETPTEEKVTSGHRLVKIENDYNYQGVIYVAKRDLNTGEFIGVEIPESLARHVLGEPPLEEPDKNQTTTDAGLQAELQKAKDALALAKKEHDATKAELAKTTTEQEAAVVAAKTSAAAEAQAALATKLRDEFSKAQLNDPQRKSLNDVLEKALKA